MKIATIIIGLALLFIYVLLINALAVVKYNQVEETQQEEIDSNSGLMVKIGIGESVDVSVKRNRWYGTINEIHSKEKSIGIVRLFGFLKLPTMVNGKSWWIFHFFALGIYLFAVTISIIIDLIFKKERRNENEDESLDY